MHRKSRPYSKDGSAVKCNTPTHIIILYGKVFKLYLCIVEIKRPDKRISRTKAPVLGAFLPFTKELVFAIILFIFTKEI
jgi:hypothetical protein